MARWLRPRCIPRDAPLAYHTMSFYEAQPNAEALVSMRRDAQEAEHTRRALEADTHRSQRWNPPSPTQVGRRVNLSREGHATVRRRQGRTDHSWPATPLQIRSDAPARTSPGHRSYGALCQLWQVDEGLSTCALIRPLQTQLTPAAWPLVPLPRCLRVHARCPLPSSL